MKAKKEMFIVKIFFLFICLFCLNALTHADIIHLKNGQALEGEVIKEDNEYIEIKIKIGEAKISRNDVESIEKNELPEGFFNDAGILDEKSGSESLQSENTKQETSVQEEKKIIYEVSVEAKFLKEDDKGVVEVYGKTNFPEGVLIYVFLKKLDIFIASLEVPVKEGQFFSRLGPFEKELPFGEYIVEAVFMPERQAKNVIEKLSESERQLISGYYVLQIGSNEEIGQNEKECIEEIESIFIELEILFRELDNNYKINLDNFNPSSWDTWSKDWLLRQGKVREDVWIRMQKYFIPLFPELDAALVNIVDTIYILYNRYSMRFKDQENFFKIYNSTDAFLGPGELNQIITENLNLVKNILSKRKGNGTS